MKKVSNGSSSRLVKSQPSARLVLLLMAVGIIVLSGVALSPPQEPSEKPWFSRIFGSSEEKPGRRPPDSGEPATNAKSASHGNGEKTSSPNPYASGDTSTAEGTLSHADGSNHQALDPQGTQTVEPERIEGPGEQHSDDAEPDDLAEKDVEELSISGWVRTETGDPVPGLEVSGLLKRSFATAQGEASGPGQRRLTVRTDANGAFRFGRVSDGEYEVRVDANGHYDSARVVVRAGVDSVVLVVRDTLSREVYVYGFVDGADGNLLPGVRVVPVGVRTTESTYTDTAGNYAMYVPVSRSGRTYTLRFALEGYRESLLPLQIGKTDEAESFQLNARLEPVGGETSVAGSVESSDGSPVHGAVVQLSSPIHRRSYRAVSDRSGQFVVSDIEVGEGYRLWVRSEGYRDYLQEGVTVSHGGRQLPVTLEPLGNGTLAGRMVDSRDKPVPGFTLWVRSSRATSQPLQVTGDRAGVFSVDNVPEGAVNLSSQSTPFVTVSGTGLASGTDKEVEVTLDRGSYQASGEVVDANGEPMPGARARLLWTHNENGIRSHSRRETAADANGLFRFSQLGPGVHTLIVEAPGYRSARIEHDVGSNGASIPIQLVAL